MTMALIVAFSSGAFAAVTICFWFFRSKHEQNGSLSLRRALEGVWVERIPGSIGHSVTIGHIRFDMKKKMFVFDGTNYSDDLHPYCYFETISSSVNLDSRSLLYYFKAQLDGQLNVTYYGYGWVGFSENGGNFSVDNGHYVSVDVDPKAMTHSMIKLSMLQARGSWKKVYSPDEMVTIIRAAKFDDLITYKHSVA